MPEITPETTLDAWLHRCPLVAILRGVKPDEVVEIGTALVEAGFAIIEVPLNSPDPMESIAKLAAALETEALIGAGTVRTAAQVEQVYQAGGRLIVMPHADLAVVEAAKQAGMITIPGIFTPTEAFAMLDAGADALKLFPAEAASPAHLKALKAVLPPETTVLPVGGITPSSMGPWVAAGAAGFGLGSALYKPGMAAEKVVTNARAFLSALRTE